MPILPGWQRMQLASDLAPTADEYVPAGQLPIIFPYKKKEKKRVKRELELAMERKILN